jgi:hypothetical protein
MLAPRPEPFAETLIFPQAGDETLGEASQAARDAHCYFLSPGSR